LAACIWQRGSADTGFSFEVSLSWSGLFVALGTLFGSPNVVQLHEIAVE
jgi:hypothetical protein